MKLRVTIRIFSGRPDPVLTLDSRRSAELMKLIESSPVKVKGKEVPTGPFALGYRGIVIEDIETKIKSGRNVIFAVRDIVVRGRQAYRIKGNVDDFILANLDHIEEKTPPRFKSFLSDAIKYLYERWDKLVFVDWGRYPNLLKCTCAPLYEPDWWNQAVWMGDPQDIQPNNNCYNYGCNYRTDNYAQPGMASGNMYTSLSACNVGAGQVSAKQGAISDCLIDAPLANNKCPKEGHLVALVVAPNYDYHWYRKNRNGYWSHKVGGSPATNLDNSMNFIKDPRTCDRGVYTEFCTFMIVMHGHIKLKGPF
jgi:hypothetical protein